MSKSKVTQPNYLACKPIDESCKITYAICWRKCFRLLLTFLEKL